MSEEDTKISTAQLDAAISAADGVLYNASGLLRQINTENSKAETIENVRYGQRLEIQGPCIALHNAFNNAGQDMHTSPVLSAQVCDSVFKFHRFGSVLPHIGDGNGYMPEGYNESVSDVKVGINAQETGDELEKSGEFKAFKIKENCDFFSSEKSECGAKFIEQEIENAAVPPLPKGPGPM